MKRLLQTSLMLLVIIATAQAQDHTITVVGQGIAQKTADQAKLSFTIEQEGKDLREAYSNAQTYLSHIYAALLAVGIDTTALRQSQTRLDEVRKWIVSKKAKSILLTDLTIDNLALVDSVLSVLGRHDIKDASDISYSVKDQPTLTREAYASAVRNGLDNAEAAAKAAGCLLGAVIRIEEILPSDRITSANRYGIVAQGYKQVIDFAPWPPVPPGEIGSTVTLAITFALENGGGAP